MTDEHSKEAEAAWGDALPLRSEHWRKGKDWRIRCDLVIEMKLHGDAQLAIRNVGAKWGSCPWVQGVYKAHVRPHLRPGRRVIRRCRRRGKPVPNSVYAYLF